MGGEFFVLPRCVPCSSPPCPRTPLAAAWSLPGVLCPHGSAARPQNPGPVSREALGFGAPHETAAEAPPGRGLPGAIFWWRQQLGTLLPTAGPLGVPSGDPTLTSVCTSLESLGPALSLGSAQPVAQATPAAPPHPCALPSLLLAPEAVLLTAGAAQPPSGLANFLSSHAEAVTWNCWVWHYFPHLTKHRVVFPLACCQVPLLSVTHAHDLSSLFPCGEQRPTSCTAGHRTDACLSSLFRLCSTPPRC